MSFLLAGRLFKSLKHVSDSSRICFIRKIVEFLPEKYVLVSLARSSFSGNTVAQEMTNLSVESHREGWAQSLFAGMDDPGNFDHIPTISHRFLFPSKACWISSMKFSASVWLRNISTSLSCLSTLELYIDRLHGESKLGSPLTYEALLVLKCKKTPSYFINKESKLCLIED